MSKKSSHNLENPGTSGAPTASDENPYCVVLKNVQVQYNSNIPILKSIKKGKIVLNNCSMVIERKRFFSLLGAQSSGKTTTLKTIVGLKSYSKGEVWVLGGTPGSRYNKTAGPKVGYMPQDLALYGEFSILETLRFFGQIYKMKSDIWLKQTKKYFEMLSLPNLNRQVKFLSGGQRRRLSFIIAINHKPQLIILDEPCVGVDPLVRRIMWDILRDLVNLGKTVIMTTQYIEEANDADEVAFLYKGKIIAQDSPANLKTKYKMSTISEVFFKITQVHDGDDDNITPEEDLQTAEKNLQTGEMREMPALNYVKTPVIRKILPRCGKRQMTALLFKNSIRYIRNWKLVAFLLILPILQVIIFNLTMGTPSSPRKRRMGVVNKELRDGFQKAHIVSPHCPVDDECIVKSSEISKSCTYLNIIKKNDIELEYYPNEETAEEALSKSEIFGTLKFEKGFTRSLKQFTMHNASGEDFTRCQLYVNLDTSKPQEASELKSVIYSAYQNFTEKLATECGQSRDVAKLTPVFLEPIWGSMYFAKVIEFVTPGSLCVIIFFLSVSVTALSLLEDKTEGLHQRSYVAGVTFGEMLLSHTIIQLVIVFVQTNLVVLVHFGFFGNKCKGYYALFVLILILQGMVGASLGYFISAVCSQEETAIELSLGLLFPIIILSGVFWSVENIKSSVARWIAKRLPMTYAVVAGRNMISRGWNISNWEVSRGLLTSFIWAAMFWILAFVFGMAHFK